LKKDFFHYASIRKSFSYKLLLCGLLTLLVMYSHRFLPAKTLVLLPTKDVKAFIYTDNDSPGKPVVSWIDFEGLHWRCDIPDDGKNHGCGFNISLGAGLGSTGIDLSGYDSIKVDLTYTGADKHVRFYIRNYEPRFSDINNISTQKFNNTSIATTNLTPDLELLFTEFSVAEWWILDYQVPRELAHPNVKNAVAFGVELSYFPKPGRHDFKFNKIELVGLWVSAEHWYLSIIVFWITLILVGGGLNLIRLKREYNAEKARLEQLISQNSALEMETNKYKQLSMLDQLTGLLNRHGLSEYISKNFSGTHTHKTGMIIIDIDFFKKINDNYGHDKGDIVLKKIAEVIQQNIRTTDYSARWGGEEFVILLPNSTTLAAQLIAEKLRSLVALAHYDDLPELQVTISLGVGAIEGDELFHMLFRRVDLALYQAKAQGRNRTVVAQSQ
jgi:diguanylate cyclase (GGDEF)-like protein